MGTWKGGKAQTGSEGWNVVGGVDGKINAMSDCNQVFETDMDKYVALLSPQRLELFCSSLALECLWSEPFHKTYVIILLYKFYFLLNIWVEIKPS